MKIKLVSGKEVDQSAVIFWVNKKYCKILESIANCHIHSFLGEDEHTSEIFATREEAEEWLENYKENTKTEEMVSKPEALRYNEGKTPLHLVPYESVEEIAKVLDFGAKKYAEDNWKKGLSVKKCMGSLLRHAFAYMKGEKVDPETGLSHIAHIGCNVFFILWYEKHKPDLYDIK